MAKTDTPWTDADLAQLRALWVQEPRLSTAEIGRRMRRTKSGVIGKARRLSLPGRPSPVVVPAAQPRPQVVAPPVPAEPVIVFKPRASGACLFPMWPDHARPTHRYCGKPCEPGKHYCSEHHARCYTRVAWGQRDKISAETVTT